MQMKFDMGNVGTHDTQFIPTFDPKPIGPKFSKVKVPNVVHLCPTFVEIG